MPVPDDCLILLLIWEMPNKLPIILRLHYVPGSHGRHVSDNREQNGITVRQRRGTVDTVKNFLTVQKSATAVTAEMRNVMGRDKTG